MARRKKNPIVRALSQRKLKKAVKKLAKKRKGTRKVRGNLRMPTVAAAKQYLAQVEKFSDIVKTKPLVQLRMDEAKNIISKFETRQASLTSTRQGKGLPAQLVKLVKSSKKGRGNFKRITEKQAKTYLGRVSRLFGPEKLSSYPYKHRVWEATTVLGQEEARKVFSKGQKTRLKKRDVLLKKATAAFNAAVQEGTAVVKQATGFKGTAQQKYDALKAKHSQLFAAGDVAGAKKVNAQAKRHVTSVTKKKNALQAQYDAAVNKMKAAEAQQAKVASGYSDVLKGQAVAARRRKTRRLKRRGR